MTETAPRPRRARNGSMKLILTIMGGLFLVAGLVWCGQGLNIVPGTFMTGQLAWAIIGAVEAVLGVGLLVIARKAK